MSHSHSSQPSAVDPWVAELRPCPDEECGGIAEPEGDADLRYFSCADCGYTFGWEQVQQQSDGCQLGIPEDVRRAAQPEAGSGPQPVFLGGIAMGSPETR
jgi:hypothetical protein